MFQLAMLKFRLGILSIDFNSEPHVFMHDTTEIQVRLKKRTSIELFSSREVKAKANQRAPQSQLQSRWGEAGGVSFWLRRVSAACLPALRG